MEPMKPLFVGVDLGTTNSAAAVFDGDAVAMVRSQQGGALTPSVVRIDSRGSVMVGGRARRFLDSDADNTRGEFKRLMGTAERLKFPAAGVERRPEELAAEVLKALRADVQEQLGVAAARAVISVPALFELPQSAATSEAARLAGFERVELIQEPVASALAAGWSASAATGSWLVYDLGGGTFDASLLETREGLLRVVGHDGDNFLGGRDFDLALVDWVLGEVSRERKVEIGRGEARWAAGVRKLKLAVEEVKIELTRSQRAALTVPGAFEVGGERVDVDLDVTRAQLEALCAPLIERSVEVCLRLLARHGLAAGALERVVLVGGPTVMPALRARVAEALAARFGEGLDPMTLVAQGAALYAASVGLDARGEAGAAGGAGGAAAGAVAGRKVWLQYPAMSADLTPHVVGRVMEGGPGSGPAPVKVRMRRADGGFSVEAAVDAADGGFVTLIELLPRRSNAFALVGLNERGGELPVTPASFSVVHGVSIGDPPLSRSIGVALASDAVQVYFERGMPLPARRTFVHRTVATVARGASESVLKIPIVQGELERAHLCRLVGTLDIGGAELKATLPVGSSVEVTLEIDRGGHLTARALVPVLGQVFDRVAHLLSPDASPETLRASATALAGRLAELRTDAFRRGVKETIARLGEVENALADVERDLEAARGGDADAAQKARRTLLELDARMEEVEAERRWPELEQDARDWLAWAASNLAAYGSPVEQKLFDEVAAATQRAREARQVGELARQLRVVRQLNAAAFNKNPRAWEMRFDSVASRVDAATDLPRAQTLVKDGRRAVERGDSAALRRVVEELWGLMPPDAEDRKLGFDSGVQ